MRRGDFVAVSLPGDFGKPRPGLIVQADQFDDVASVTVLPLSSLLIEAPLVRITVRPTSLNGLREVSQVMVDKAMTIRRDKVGAPFGHLEDETMLAVSRSLAFFLGFG
jgi:mRNA interferase MazF